MEGVKSNPMAKTLAYLGIFLIAGGGIFYAVASRNDTAGLLVAGGGLVLVAAAALMARASLASFFGSRSARLGLGAGVGVLVMLALVLLLGALAARHNIRADFTQSKEHTLAPQTLQVLGNLPGPVTAYAFYRDPQEGRAQAQELLERYHYANRKFSYRFVDPDQEPGLAKRFEVSNYGQVVLTTPERDERVKLAEEHLITNALVRLTKKGKKIIYFLKGHGERGLTDIGKDGLASLNKALELQNYQIKNLILATSPSVPADASLVVLADPQKALLKPELERLAAYLQQGGALLVLLEPLRGDDLAPWLAARGVKVGQDMVFDKASSLFGASPAWPLAAKYGFHKITGPMTDIFCYFPLCRSVDLVAKLPQGVQGVRLVESSPRSWAETDLATLAKDGAKFDQGKDAKGPVSLAVAVTLPPSPPAPDKKDKKADQPPQPPRPGNLVVVGDCDFVSNTHLDQAGNRDLIQNTVAFLAGEEDLVSISPRPEANQPLLLEPHQARLVFWLPVVVLPLILLVVGLVVVLGRRRRA